MYRIPRFAGVFHKFGVMANVFNEEELAAIANLEKTLKFENAKIGIGGDGHENPIVRRTKMAGIDARNEDIAWLYEKLAHIVPRVNYDLFMLDIDAIEGLQYLIYDEEEAGFYDWHIDDGEGPYNEHPRKISAVIGLTDPSEYEGGDLHIVREGRVNNPEVVRLNRGDIVFFSSKMPHTLMPVIRGTRKVIVFWVHGKHEV